MPSTRVTGTGTRSAASRWRALVTTRSRTPGMATSRAKASGPPLRPHVFEATVTVDACRSPRRSESSPTIEPSGNRTVRCAPSGPVTTCASPAVTSTKCSAASPRAHEHIPRSRLEGGQERRQVGQVRLRGVGQQLESLQISDDAFPIAHHVVGRAADGNLTPAIVASPPARRTCAVPSTAPVADGPGRLAWPWRPGSGAGSPTRW